MSEQFSPIYLDHAATSPVLPAVAGTIYELLTQHFGNPSSSHSLGQKAGKYLREARANASESLAFDPSQVIWTASCSESNNWVLNWAVKNGLARIYLSPLEHASVYYAAEYLRPVIEVVHIPVNPEGIAEIDFLQVEAKLGRIKNALVCLMAVNNETGVEQDTVTCGQLVRDCGGFFFTDVTQAIGKLDILEVSRRAHFISSSLHKFGGPKGIGILAYRDVRLFKHIQGGAQEFDLRAGTENLPYICGGSEALVTAVGNWQAATKHFQELHTMAVAGLRACGLEINGHVEKSNFSVVNFSLPKISSDIALIRYDEAGICLSNGSACGSGAKLPSRVLTAMGKHSQAIKNALRISFSPQTTTEEIAKFLEFTKSLL